MCPIGYLRYCRSFICTVRNPYDTLVFEMELKIDILLPFPGAVKLMLFPFFCGAAVIVMHRFDPIGFCSNIKKYQITFALVVPPVLVLMAKHSGRLFHHFHTSLTLLPLAVDKYDFSTLRVLYSGAAPLGAPLVKAVCPLGSLPHRSSHNLSFVVKSRSKTV